MSTQTGNLRRALRVAARLVTFAAADDPRNDTERVTDATTKVIAKARAKATDTQG